MKLMDKGHMLSWAILIPAGILLAAAIIFLTLNNQDIGEQKKTIPVKTLIVIEETLPLELEYMGTVSAEEIKKLGFKIAGRLGKVHVEKGSPILPGDPLASLDTTELQNSALAAENARFKARRSCEFARDNYQKLAQLKEAGAVSAQELDKAQLELDVQEANYKNAQLDFENKMQMLKDAQLKADFAGYAADILYKEGEIVSAGSPVMVLRSEKLMVQTGLSQQDAGRVSPGQSARIVVDGREAEGSIIRVAQLPDKQTRTYLAEIEVTARDFPLGANARVFIRIGEERGVFLPITCVLNDETDYVFVVNEDSTVGKRKVMLGNIRETRVKVEGLQAGDRVVVEGMKRLNQEDRVAIK